MGAKLKILNKNIIYIFLLSVFLELVVALFRWAGSAEWISFEGLSTIAGAFIFFFWTLFCLKRYSIKSQSRYILISILLGASLLELPVHILYFRDTFTSFIELLIRCIAIIGAYGVFSMKTKRGKIVLSAGCLIFLCAVIIIEILFIF